MQDHTRRPVSADPGTYDLILVGSGFASSFFLHRYLRSTTPTTRVLVLERGEMRLHDRHITHDRESVAEADESFSNRTPNKPWRFRLAFGGSSNCWWPVPRGSCQRTFVSNQPTALVETGP